MHVLLQAAVALSTTPSSALPPCTATVQPLARCGEASRTTCARMPADWEGRVGSLQQQNAGLPGCAPQQPLLSLSALQAPHHVSAALMRRWMPFHEVSESYDGY